MDEFYKGWLKALDEVPFGELSGPGKADWIILRHKLRVRMDEESFREAQLASTHDLHPFLDDLSLLIDQRPQRLSPNAEESAEALTKITQLVKEARRNAEKSGAGKIKDSDARRAHATIRRLKDRTKEWFEYSAGYNPMFTWWVDEPYKTVEQSLTNYATFLNDRVNGTRTAAPTTMPTLGAAAPAGGGPGGGRGAGGAGGGFGSGGGGGQRGGFGGGGGTANARAGDASDIIGDPIGREALMIELQAEMIPYTPEELIAIGWKELAWCEEEMKKASRELGFGDDWHKALEHVKNKYVEPGKQPEMIKALALEATEYVEKNNLLTVPPLAKEDWAMEMMSPQQQLVSPFFLGGQNILVSYPTNTMAHEQKMMSMRGNNPHFSKATVHHELIPGHHLQGFMTSRYKTYRGLFGTPFWGEGWALYWELLLWDMKFPTTPEDRIGFLFWRSHRCARIVFSLSFHMEKMTPQQCIDLLVNKVGHEVDNATAEVRRSFAGTYGPLYQAAYLLGGLQIYSLHKELVDSGKMTNKVFHDTILRENRIPIEMVRALLTKQKLTRDHKTNWKFYGPVN